MVIKYFKNFLTKNSWLLTTRPMSKTQATSFVHNANEDYSAEKLIYASASRNQEPILQVLKRFLTFDDDETHESRLFLEVASGSGQHLFHFAPHFPHITFQPSEVDEKLLGSINYYADKCPTKNIRKPYLLDIIQKLSVYGFIENSIDFIYSCNLIHISPYEVTINLFKNAGIYLKQDALLITYGPYMKDGIITPESNVAFDESLRSRNPEWGLRDLNDLIKLAEENNLSLLDTVEMPSNNKTLIWKKN